MPLPQGQVLAGTIAFERLDVFLPAWKLPSQSKLRQGSLGLQCSWTAMPELGPLLYGWRVGEGWG